MLGAVLSSMSERDQGETGHEEKSERIGADGSGYISGGGPGYPQEALRETLLSPGTPV